MATTNKPSVLWVCRKCGRKVRDKERPGALRGGKCPKSPAGTHSYVKG